MKKTIVMLALMLAAVSAVGAGFALPANAATISGVEKASMGGRYTDLLETLDVPQDSLKFGDFYELGFQTRTSYQGYTGLPNGYWVYVKPYWYIWKTKAGETGSSLDYTRASVNGKYETILKTFSMPTDRDKFGELYDWGLRTTTTYGTNRNLPTGYWVYAYPYWYIWKTKAGKPGSSLDYTKASVNGKYETILKTFSVPTDRDKFGELYEWGLRTTTTYGTNRNLPKGYWVYAYPYWYIWKTKKEDKPQPPDYTKGAVDGKYQKILKTIYVPKDKDKFGETYEWGYRDTTTYAGVWAIPKGYWVYAAPYWYIWGKETKIKKKMTDEKRASVNGRYTNLLKTLSVPRDREDYGDFFEFGYAEDNEYAGYTGLPPGYWVYVYPKWYIWRDMKGSPGPNPAPYPSPAPSPNPDDRNDPTSAYGKYYNLEKEISAPFDIVKFGNYYDRGYSTDREYGPIRDLPPGYWVYVFPTWYIWEKQRDTGR